MIGLFLGDTDFSDIVLKKIKKLDKKYFIIDLSKNNKFKKDTNSNRISIGKFGKIINLIKEKKSKKVLFAGKIVKPKFSTLRLDLKGVYYMPNIIRAAKSGDAAIIKAIIKILDNENIRVISSIFFNPELTVKSGNYTKLKPNMSDSRSIKKGITYFDKLNNLDHVQAVIVKDSAILAIEDRYGTKKMLSKLKKKGIDHAFVTLHVGAGTFQPVKVENIESHKMHSEYYEISQKTVDQIAKTRSKGGRVIAVGTTALRTLESVALKGNLSSQKGETDIFIYPGFEFQLVDVLITNFHLPKSSLLMLVSAFIGFEKMIETYHYAIKERYRFFSYGDAMLIEKN